MNMEDRRTLVPVYDTVILPDVDYRLNMGGLGDREKEAFGEPGRKVVIVPLREGKDAEEVTAETCHEYGVHADVVEIEESRMGAIVHLITHEKVRIHDFLNEDGKISCLTEVVDEVMDVTSEGERHLLDELRRKAMELASNIRGGEYAIEFIKTIKTVNEFASAFCQFFDMTPEEKYALLETNSFKERGSMVHDALLRFKSTVDLQIDLANRDDEENNNYKKAAIQKQIGILQKELDNMNPEAEEDETSFKYKIEHCGMPEEVQKEAKRVLRRFEQEPTNGAEYNSLYDYLDFITSLSWEVGEPSKIDLKKARKILDRDHYGLEKVKERILQHLAVISLKGKQNGSILLLVGAPGTGKTSMGKSIAEALGRKYVRISLGGIRDEAEIRGHRRTYIGSMPGRIMTGIKRSGAMDPVVVLDEVDKLQSSYNGDPSAALLEVLDPEQNSTFTDHYVDLPYDLSHVFFVCTANSWDMIPKPLLDRMEIIDLPGYTPVEHFQIAKRHLVPQAIEETGLDKEDIRFTNGAIKKIIDEYTMEAGVRGLKKQLLAVCRKAAVRIVEEEVRPVIVKDKDVEGFLGRKKINHDKILKVNPPGVATGLAWTQAGGEILFIETVAMKGTGQIHLTGQIGDVMRESAETAVSLVKAIFVDKNLDFMHYDIHIHIPEGAVPKDGPSAGITMFTAVTSLVTGIEVNRYLAMTGEISLRGEVLPIGGLPEKLMAAVRAGVRKVLIPKQNMPDLEDVPEETKEKLEIVPVATINDVAMQALGLALPERRSMPIPSESDEPESRE
ncbi:MAG: endopeptidase La [Lachnospiraceae bacterium]|nr:endopeptidase La [Lachnospiraceae bacterium]